MQKLENETKYAILDDKYYILLKVGSGATSKVKLCKPKDQKQLDQINTQMEEKLKICDLENKNYETFNYKAKYDTKTYFAAKLLEASHNIKHFESEIFTLSKINHKNVISLIDYGVEGIIKKPQCNTSCNDVATKVNYVILEYALNGELFDYLYFPKTPLKENIAQILFKMIINGLEAMHIKDICHRDLKTENMMMDKDWNLKIADFGYATVIKQKNFDYSESNSNKDYTLNTFLGTLSYAAPEILLKIPYDGKKVDIFSLGVILFVFVTGRMPFAKAVSHDNYYKHISKKDFETFWILLKDKIPYVSLELKSLINSLLSFQPEERLSLEQIKKCDWMKEYFNKEKDLEILKDEEDLKILKEEMEKRKEIVIQMKEIEAKMQEAKLKVKRDRDGNEIDEDETLNKSDEEVNRSHSTNNKSSKYEVLEDVAITIKGERVCKDLIDPSVNPFKFKILAKDHNKLLNYVANFFSKSDERKKVILINKKNCKLNVRYANTHDIVIAGDLNNQLEVNVIIKKSKNNELVVELEKVCGLKDEFCALYENFVTSL